MDLQSIRATLRSEPFRPFEFCLADGRRVPVKHPEFVAMNPRTVVVLDGRNFYQMIDPVLIVSIEPHLPAAG